MLLIDKLKNAFHSRKHLSAKDWRDVILYSSVGLLVIPYFVGTAVSLLNKQDAGLGRSWWLAFSKSGIKATLILDILALGAAIIIYYVRADSKKKDEVGRTVSDTGTFGDAHFQTLEEIKNYYTLSDQENANRIILGTLDKENKIIVSEHKWDKKHEAPINKNIFLLASAGSGKTTSILYNIIFQLAINGEGMFITDPKGEIYETYSHYLEKKGYDVYTFITKSDIMEVSDRFNPLDFLDMNINKIRSLASALYDFDPEEQPEYFQNGEINFFIALCAYFTNPELSHPKEANTLSYMYKYICTNDQARVTSELLSIPQGAPGYEEARQFVRNASRYEDFCGGLQQTLQKFNSKDCATMISASDFEPLDFVDRKCALFLIVDDHDSTFDSLTRMFFNLFVNRISEIADRLPNKMTPDFNMVLEETNNIGKIHTLDKLISTVRGRKMNTILTFQNIEQMKSTYKDQRESLISACHTQMFFGVNDPATAEYISKYLGTKTIQTDATSRSEGTLTVADIILHESHRYDEKAVELMAPGNITKNKQIIVKTFLRDPMLLYPMFFEKHNEAPLLEKHMLADRLPKRKRPKEYYDYYGLPYLDPKEREEHKKEVRKKLQRRNVDEEYAKLLNVPIIEDDGLLIETPKAELNPEAANLDKKLNENKKKKDNKKVKEDKPDKIVAVTTVQDQDNKIIKQTVQVVTPEKPQSQQMPKPRFVNGKEIPQCNNDISDDDII